MVKFGSHFQTHLSRSRRVIFFKTETLTVALSFLHSFGHFHFPFLTRFRSVSESRCCRSRYRHHVDVLHPSFTRIAGRVTSRQTLWLLRLLQPQSSVQHMLLISPLFPFSQSLSHVTILFLERCCGEFFLHISPSVHDCVVPHQDGALAVVVELSSRRPSQAFLSGV